MSFGISGWEKRAGTSQFMLVKDKEAGVFSEGEKPSLHPPISKEDPAECELPGDRMWYLLDVCQNLNFSKYKCYLEIKPDKGLVSATSQSCPGTEQWRRMSLPGSKVKDDLP